MEKKQEMQPEGSKFGNTKAVLKKIGFVLSEIWKWIMRFHGILLAVPVVVAALRISVYAREHLPEKVGILMLQSGEYAWTVAREVAVQGCLAVTAFCLLMMLLSHRTIFPWIVSIFSLVLPYVLIFTNWFPVG